MSATTSTATSLTALQQALTPKTGMQRIPLSLETWQNPNTTSSKKLLNMYAEKQPDDARVAAALLSTPGFTVFMNVGTGPIRAINDDDPGAIYVVSGTHFWLVTAGAGTATDLGDIGVAHSPFSDDYLFYTIAVGPTAAVVCSPPNAYVSVGGGPVAQITTTWPDYGASSVAFLDGYYVFTGQGAPQFFFITKLADPTAVDALDFAALDAFPNAMFKVERLGTDLWFAGASGWEIWYDAGNADFPFRRRPNGSEGHCQGRREPVLVQRGQPGLSHRRLSGAAHLHARHRARADRHIQRLCLQSARSYFLRYEHDRPVAGL
jgi:hypothetical protein